MKKGVKQDTPIQSIRKQYVAGVYSFAKFVNHFEPLSKYVDDNEKEVLPFLTTPSRTPPKEFQAIAEQCLRSVGRLKNSPFGQACMSTASAWNKVEPYKKAWMWEAWLSTVLKLESQNPWTKADWARVQLRRLFTVFSRSTSCPFRTVWLACASRGRSSTRQTGNRNKHPKNPNKCDVRHGKPNQIQVIPTWGRQVNPSNCGTPMMLLLRPLLLHQKNGKETARVRRAPPGRRDPIMRLLVKTVMLHHKKSNGYSETGRRAPPGRSQPRRSQPPDRPPKPHLVRRKTRKRMDRRVGVNAEAPIVLVWFLNVSRANIYVGIFSAQKTNSFDSQARHICSISC